MSPPVTFENNVKSWNGRWENVCWTLYCVEMTLNRPTKPLFRFRCKQNSGLEQCRKAILPHSFFYWRCYVTFGRMFIYLPLFCVHFILPKFTRSSNHLEMDHAQRTLNKVMFNNKISYFSAWSGHCLFFYLFFMRAPLISGDCTGKGTFWGNCNDNSYQCILQSNLFKLRR